MPIIFLYYSYSNKLWYQIAFLKRKTTYFFINHNPQFYIINKIR